MSDVIKMVRPPPRNDKGEADDVREALYGYLIGKNIDDDKLPALPRAFEAWKRGKSDPPDVPFEMLTPLPPLPPLPLSATHWKELARRVDKGVPREIVDGIKQALEYSVSNVPELGGRVVLCPDVSGSMQSPVTGHRGTATTKVRCVDVAALVTAAILRRNPGPTVVPFSDDVVHLDRPLDPLDSIDSIVKNAERLASLPNGGTSRSAPLHWLNARGEAPDVVVFVSANQSWSDFRLSARHDPNGTRGTVMAEEWQRLRGRNPKAKLILIDVQQSSTTQVLGGAARDDVLNVGGFSDAVFDVISAFTRGDLAGCRRSWLRAIEWIALD